MSRRLSASGWFPWSGRDSRRLADMTETAAATSVAADAAFLPRWRGRSSSAHCLAVSRSQGWLIPVNLRFPLSPKTARSHTSLRRSVSGEARQRRTVVRSDRNSVAASCLVCLSTGSSSSLRLPASVWRSAVTTARSAVTSVLFPASVRCCSATSSSS